jgi:hypothetical protein
MALETLEGVDKINDVDIAHLDSAIPKEEYLELIKNKFIIHGKENNTVIFKIQDGPIKESGLNGCQVSDMIAVAKHIISGLNDKFPCDENKVTLYHLSKALEAQEARTKNRETRGVEGTNNA